MYVGYPIRTKSSLRLCKRFLNDKIKIRRTFKVTIIFITIIVIVVCRAKLSPNEGFAVCLEKRDERLGGIKGNNMNAYFKLCKYYPPKRKETDELSAF